MITTPLPRIPVYYDVCRKTYWLPDAESKWIELTEPSLKRQLRAHGYQSEPDRGKLVSEVEEELNRYQMEQNVVFAGAVAGQPKGIIKMCQQRILVTDSPLIIEPKDGDCPNLDRFFKTLFKDRPEQLYHFFGWLKVGYESLRSGKHRPGQVLAIAGPKDCGKSLVQAIITEVYGGRAAKPYRYMSGETPFNSELFGAEHLIIEDEFASTDMRQRRHFGARIKDFTVNQIQSHHGKGRQAISLIPFWRVSISLNDEPENLAILPPIDESLSDKIILLKASKAELPGETQTLEGRDRVWKIFMDELPAFLHSITKQAMQPEYHSERFGVTHYHHPDLLTSIDGMSPEQRLMELIDTELFNSPAPGTWKGTAERLESILTSSMDVGYMAKKLLNWPTATGTYLARLLNKHPERIKQNRTKARRLWEIRPPGAELVTE
ncbi:MAG: hypothetical protein JWM16_5555 [Verrucomicrobiales bacterium]|nr:hypothetical protein [Verrucomicrobiales bacterium]